MSETTDLDIALPLYRPSLADPRNTDAPLPESRRREQRYHFLAWCCRFDREINAATRYSQVPSDGIGREGADTRPVLRRFEREIRERVAPAFVRDHDHGPFDHAIAPALVEGLVAGDVGAVIELAREPVPAEGRLIIRPDVLVAPELMVDPALPLGHAIIDAIEADRPLHATAWLEVIEHGASGEAGNMPVDAVTLRRLEAGKAKVTAGRAFGVVET
jgi:hypothetical protein